MATKTKTMTVRELQVDALIFIRLGTPDHYYVGFPDAVMDGAAYWHDEPAKSILEEYRTGSRQSIAVRVIEPDGYGNHWFAMYVVDCMSPPITVVRADSFQDAFVTFLNANNDTVIQDCDLADYREDDSRITYDDSGRPHDTELIDGWPVQLAMVHVHPADRLTD